MEAIATILHADLDAFYASVEQLLAPSRAIRPSCDGNLALSDRGRSGEVAFRRTGSTRWCGPSPISSSSQCPTRASRALHGRCARAGIEVIGAEVWDG